jgi:hypothetical protein
VKRKNDDSGKDPAWYCLRHFKEMRVADDMLPYLQAHLVAMLIEDEWKLQSCPKTKIARGRSCHSQYYPACSREN